jgi:hypothetical protein
MVLLSTVATESEFSRDLGRGFFFARFDFDTLDSYRFPSGNRSAFPVRSERATRVFAIFIFISGFSCNEKSDFEQLFKFQFFFISILCFIRQKIVFFFIHNFFHT